MDDSENMNLSTTPIDVRGSASRPGLPSALRGWLLVYVIGLVMQALHGLGLTLGAIVIFADPARAGLTSFMPLGGLLFYVVTNIVLAVYTAIVIALMIRRRKAPSQSRLFGADDRRWVTARLPPRQLHAYVRRTKSDNFVTATH